MLTQICKSINNWFTYDDDKHIMRMSIEGGVINPPLTIEDGRYYRIIGSRFNDGVWLYDSAKASPLTDEAEFDGAVWLMSVPKDFIELAKKIEAWQDKNSGIDSANMSPFQSESFDIYSYSKGSKSGSVGANGTAVTWRDMFAKELSLYRKVGM